MASCAVKVEDYDHVTFCPSKQLLNQLQPVPHLLKILQTLYIVCIVLFLSADWQSSIYRTWRLSKAQIVL